MWLITLQMCENFPAFRNQPDEPSACDSEYGNHSSARVLIRVCAGTYTKFFLADLFQQEINSLLPD